MVAVVGDGAMTGGMCWEALGNIGAASDRPVIVVLNDNGRSYSPTVGSFAEHLRMLRLAADGVRPLRSERGNLFTALGFAYLGPVDGHDTSELEAALVRAKDLGRPVVVHAVTVKGKGYRPAEENDEDCLHAVGVIDPATGADRAPARPSWTQVFAEELTAIGADRPERRRAHRGDAAPDRAWPLRGPLPPPRLRCRHGRTARRHQRRWPRHGRPAPSGGDLLDLPEPGFRPGAHGRRPAPAASDFRAGPGGRHRP